MPGQLKVLLAGRHPKTSRPLPKPVSLKQWQATKAVQHEQCQDIEIWRGRGSTDWPIQNPPRLEDDGTEFTRAFLRKGKPQVDPNRPSLVERIRAKQPPQQNQLEQQQQQPNIPGDTNRSGLQLTQQPPPPLWPLSCGPCGVGRGGAPAGKHHVEQQQQQQ